MPRELQDDEMFRAVVMNFGMDLPYNERRDYVKILEFFSDVDDFTAAVELVSRDLWKAYNRHGSASLNGRFTLALKDVATAAGFAYPDFTVFTGPLHPPTFLAHIRRGYFWKDSFAPEHGEFSHAIQWLAIRKHFGKHLNAPLRYRRTADIKSVVPIYNFDRFRRGISMWPWLCDCFPMRHLTGQVDGEAEENFSFCNSDTFRLPNAVEALCRGAPDTWFIGAIARYRQRKNASDGERVLDVFGQALTRDKVNRTTRRPLLRNNMAMISMAQTLRKERDPVRYMPHGEDPLTRIWHRFVPTEREVAPEQVPVTFHGIAGSMARHVLENTPGRLTFAPDAPLRHYENQGLVSLAGLNNLV